MKDKLIAFDDTEVSDWLMDLIEDESRDFLSAFAEAVVGPMPKTTASSVPD